MTEQSIPGCSNMPFGGPFTDQPPTLAASADLSRGRAALIERFRWPQDKKVLFVGFLNGGTMQDKVKAAVPEWSKYCRMVFDFSPRDPRQCDILINFLPNPAQQVGEGTYNSYLGTDCPRLTRAGQASMNLVFPANTAADFMSGTILHEFGHALGLDHEHKRPDKPFKWVPQKVYEWAARMGGPWRDPNFVNQQVINPFNEAFKASRFDPLSIMMYPFPPGLATYADGSSFSTRSNFVLSRDDKDFIEQIYPPRPGRIGGGKIIDRELDLDSGSASDSGTIDDEVSGYRYHFTLPRACLVSFRTDAAAAPVRGTLFGPDDPKSENPAPILRDTEGVNLRQDGRLMEPGAWWLRVAFREEDARGDYRLRVTVEQD